MTLGRIKRALRRLLPAARRGRSVPVDPSPPEHLVSIIVPGYNVHDYLGDCLESILTQDYPHLEVIVIDDGSSDDTYEIAQEWAARDPRVRPVRQDNAGLSATRNRGAHLSKGEYIWFVDSDDTITPGAVRKFVAALDKTGSDFAVASYNRFNSTRRWKAAPWIRAAHARERLGVSLREWPEAAINAIACSKMFRRSFWDEAALQFPVGVTYEDQPVTAKAYAVATAFDYLDFEAYSWRRRDDGTSITQQVHTATDLKARMVAARHALTTLAQYSVPVAVEARRKQLLANDIPRSTIHIADSGDEFWTELVAGIRALIPGDPLQVLQKVPPQHAVLNWLIYRGERASAEEFVTSGGREVRRWPTRTVRGRTYIEYPPEWFDIDIPDEILEFPEASLTLSAHALRAVWVSENRLEITGWAYIKFVDLAQCPTEIDVLLVNPRTGSEVRLPVEMRELSMVDSFARHESLTYGRSGFVATLDLQESGPDLTSREYEFWARVTSGGIERRTRIERVRRTGALHLLAARRVGNRVMRIVVDRESHVNLRVAHVKTPILGIETDDAGTELLVDVKGVRGTPSWRGLELLHRRSGERILIPVVGVDHAGVLRVRLPDELPFSAEAGGINVWDARLVAGKARHSMQWRAAPETAPIGQDLGSYSLKETASGHLGIVSYPTLMILERVGVQSDNLVLEGSTRGASGPAALILRGTEHRFRVAVNHSGASWVSRIPLGGVGSAGLEDGLRVDRYRLEWEKSDAATQSVSAVSEQVPFDLAVASLNVRIDVAADGGLIIRVT